MNYPVNKNEGSIVELIQMYFYFTEKKKKEKKKQEKRKELDHLFLCQNFGSNLGSKPMSDIFLTQF